MLRQVAFPALVAFPESNIFFVDKMFHISRTKSCLEAELKKKEIHLQWERENERRRVRREELEKELHRQVSGKRREGKISKRSQITTLAKSVTKYPRDPYLIRCRC